MHCAGGTYTMLTRHKSKSTQWQCSGCSEATDTMRVMYFQAMQVVNNNNVAGMRPTNGGQVGVGCVDFLQAKMTRPL